MITAIIQARMESTRLPGKVLLPLGEKTILENVIDRIKQAKLIDKVVVATSINPTNDKIAELCERVGVPCFRGSENDVLDRYYQAAKEFGAEHICRITSDCPLIDPLVLDGVAKKYLEGGYDQVSNSHPVATFPDGYDCWIFSFRALEKSWNEAKLPSEREHVTSYMWSHPDKFKIFNLKSDKDLSAYRLTIDTKQDYELLKKVIENVKELTTENIINFLDQHPEIKNINSQNERDAGYKKSLEQDKRVSQ